MMNDEYSSFILLIVKVLLKLFLDAARPAYGASWRQIKA
jgi:hypothetical protein